jgi:hypothetical protein
MRALEVDGMSQAVLQRDRVALADGEGDAALQS